MKAVMLGNMDLEIYFTPEETNLLKRQNIEGAIKFVHAKEPDTTLEIQYSPATILGDGIEVKLQKNPEYVVTVYEKAMRHIISEGVWGTRYGNGEKIIIRDESRYRCPWEKIFQK